MAGAGKGEELQSLLCDNSFASSFQEGVLSAVCYAWGITSVLACLSILWSWARMSNRPTLTEASSMIICLTLSDMFLGVLAILEGSTYSGNYTTESGSCAVDAVCIFKALLAQFFGFSSFLWSACMCHSSYRQVSQIFLSFSHAHLVTQQQSSKEALLERGTWTMLQYHALCWGVPGLSTLLMLATSSAGPSGSHFCWVATDRAENDSVLPLSAAIILFLLPLLIVELYHLAVFRFLARTISQIPSAGPLLRRFTRVLALLVGCKTALLLARALRLFVPSNSSFAIGIISVIGAPLQGLGDYLVFKYDEREGELAYSSMRGSVASRSTSSSMDTGSERRGSDESNTSLPSSMLSLSRNVELTPLSSLAGRLVLNPMQDGGSPEQSMSGGGGGGGTSYSPIPSPQRAERGRLKSTATLLGSEHGEGGDSGV